VNASDSLKRPGTQAELAELIGVSEARVSQLMTDGNVQRGEALDKQLLQYCAWMREVAAGRQSETGGGLDLVHERALLSRTTRETGELRLAQLRGELIRVDAVEAVWARSLVAARDHLLQLRERLAPMLAVESDPFKIDQMLDEEMSRALCYLAGVELPAKGGAA
jgi:phage terminase Nu1 subunit (DNA packaging protein)